LAYNSRGLLHTITDFENRVWTYTYDDENRNNLVSVEGPTSLKTQYTYNRDPGTGPWYHDVNSVKDPNGQTYLVNTYGVYYVGNQLAYRVEEQTYGGADFKFNYYPDSNRTKFTDRRGYNTNIFYNDAGQVTKSKLFTKNLRESDPDFYITTYEYDSNIIEVTKKVLPAGNYITYERDPNSGNILTLAREPNDGDANIVTEFTYDPNFNFVKSITDPRQNETELKYDPNGNLETITYPEVDTPYGTRKKPVYKFTYNSYGQVETMTDPCNIITEYQYYTDSNDANNYSRLWKVIVDANDSDPGALKITYDFEYDALGRVEEVADPCGNIWGLTWDDNDLLTEITDPYGNATELAYNKCKKLEQIEREWSSDPNENQIIKFGYDILDNLKAITDPCNYVTKLSYDYSENLSEVNDAEDNATQYEYDERDLLWKVTDANGGITRYSYTLNSMLADINDSNTGGNVTSFHYDGFDRLLWIQYPDDTNEVFGYDKASNITSWRVRDGNTIKYEYDELDRLKVKNPPADPNIIIQYDIAGRVYDVNDGRNVNQGGGITSYKYDRIGRVTEVNDIEGRVVEYEYDDRGLQTRLAYLDANYVAYTYDALGRLTDVTYNGTLVAEYEYDELSRRTVLTLHDDSDVNVIYEYDIANKLMVLTNNFGGSGWGTFNYTYDKVGNRLTMTVDGSKLHDYTYNVLYEVNEVDYPTGWHSDVGYTYDALGNRKTVVSAATANYKSNNLNQYSLIRPGDPVDDGSWHLIVGVRTNSTDGEIYVDGSLVASGTGAARFLNSNPVWIGGRGSATAYNFDGKIDDVQVFDRALSVTEIGWLHGLSYDENGNLASDGLLKYYYDCENRLMEVTDANDDAVASYRYDFVGRRISKTAGGVTTKYVYDGGQVIAEYNGSDTLLRKFVYGPGVDEPICMVDIAHEGALYYYHYDGLGSVVALSDSSGDIVETYRYDVFGEPTICDGNDSVISESSFGNPYMFTGRRFDTEKVRY